MPRPSQSAQDSAMPSTPRTPTAKVLGARQSARAAAEGFKVSTPRAPRTPTRPLILHDPTSPSPMPMLRSRRDTSLPLLAQTIMGHGLRSSQQIGQRTSKSNGVSVHEESELELEARRSSNVDPEIQIQPRLIVSIPISRNKRALEVNTDDTSEDENKYRRLSQNSKTRRNPNPESSSKSSGGEHNPAHSGTIDSGFDGQTIEAHATKNRQLVRSTRSRTVEMRTKLPLDDNTEPEAPGEPGKDLRTILETVIQEPTDQSNLNVEIMDSPAIDIHQTEIGAPDDPEIIQDDLLNNIDSDVEDGEAPVVVPEFVRKEMQEFEQGFNGLQGKFKLLDKIGEGTFSSVYKAIDLEYDMYDNSKWDYSMGEQSTRPKEESMGSSDSTKDAVATTSAEAPPVETPPVEATLFETGKVVAIKRIYVTSSPRRIENEIAILHNLSGHKNVIPLITAFRFKDQVIAVLPYFEHSDFRKYYQTLPMEDIRCYLRALLNGLVHVHRHGIIHRDIKPSNFLYDTVTKTGVIVDFGLAHRQTPWPPNGSSKSRLKASSGKPTPSSTNARNTDAPKIEDTDSKAKMSHPGKLDFAPSSSKKLDENPSGTAPTVTPTSINVGSGKTSKVGFIQQNRVIATPSSLRKLGEGASVTASASVNGRMVGSGVSAKIDLLQQSRKDTTLSKVGKSGDVLSGALNASAATTISNHVEGSSVNSKIDLMQQGRKDLTHLRTRKFTEGIASAAPATTPTLVSGSAIATPASTATRQGSGVNNTPMVSNPTIQKSSNPPNAVPYGPSASQAPNMASHVRPRVLPTAPHAIPGNPLMSITITKREPGYIKKDPRPEMMVNRAGTRGFRAPEVLFRHSQQTVALDIWSVGVILCSFLTGRFPFFNSSDDADALIEMAILNGKLEMQKAAALFNRTFITNIPSIKDKGISFAKLCRILHPKRFNPPKGYGAHSNQDSTSTLPVPSAQQQGIDLALETRPDLRHLPDLQQKRFNSTSESTQLSPKSTAEGIVAKTAPVRHNDTERPSISKESTSRVHKDSLHIEAPTQPIHTTISPEPHTNPPNTAADDVDIIDDSVILNVEEIFSDTSSVTNNSNTGNPKASSQKKHVVGTDSQEDLEEAVNLLERLLDLNPRTRVTAYQALKHPFLAERQP
ncbi:hypothetical protein BGX26_010274 [Mortierella sp. AD094]|nr:hypothetical protein BGX26_010274 [Mortierella sp. AD094]